MELFILPTGWLTWHLKFLWYYHLKACPWKAKGILPLEAILIFLASSSTYLAFTAARDTLHVGEQVQINAALMSQTNSSRFFTLTPVSRPNCGLLFVRRHRPDIQFRFDIAFPKPSGKNPSPYHCTLTHEPGLVVSLSDQFGNVWVSGDKQGNVSTAFLILQTDGNLVLYDNQLDQGGKAVWASGTAQ